METAASAMGWEGAVTGFTRFWKQRGGSTVLWEFPVKTLQCKQVIGLCPPTPPHTITEIAA